MLRARANNRRKRKDEKRKRRLWVKQAAAKEVHHGSGAGQEKGVWFSSRELEIANNCNI